jgi:hypothetical protein
MAWNLRRYLAGLPGAQPVLTTAACRASRPFGFVLPRLLDGTIGFAYTLGGILAAVPLLLWAEWLRRNA